MNYEQKIKLRQDLIRETGIEIMAANFFDTCTRYKGLSRNKILNDAINQEVSRLRRKMNELQPGRYPPAPTSTLNEEEAEALQGRNLIKDLANACADVKVDTSSLLGKIGKIDELLNTLKTESDAMSNSSEDERENALSTLAQQIRSMVALIPHEPVPKASLQAINQRLRAYRKWVDQLKTRKIIARFNFIRKTVYGMAYPAWLESESVIFENSIFAIEPAFIDRQKAAIMKSLNELIGDSMTGQKSMLRTNNDTNTKLAEIRAVFGETKQTQTIINIVTSWLGGKTKMKIDEKAMKALEPKNRNVLVEALAHEIVTLELVKNISNSLINTVDELDKVLKHKTIA